MTTPNTAPATIQELLDQAGYELVWPNQIPEVKHLPIKPKHEKTLDAWGEIFELNHLR